MMVRKYLFNPKAGNNKGIEAQKRQKNIRYVENKQDDVNPIISI